MTEDARRLQRQLNALCKPVKEGEPLRQPLYLGEYGGNHLFVVDPRVEQDIRELGVGAVRIDGGGCDTAKRACPFQLWMEPFVDDG